MQTFLFDGLVVILLEDSFHCKCNGCTPRRSLGGLTFLLVEENGWSEHTTFDLMKSRFEALNPCISVSDDLLAGNIKNCLSDGTCKYDVDKSQNRLNALFEYQVDELSLCWRIEANQAPTQMIMCHLVRPLFLALEQSNKRESNILRSLERLNKRLYMSGELVYKESAAKSSIISEDINSQLTEEQNEDATVSTLKISQTVVDALQNASQILHKLSSSETTSPVVSVTSVPNEVPKEKMATNADLEKRRQEELQRKLARELERSKSKRTKKTGILRK